MDQRSGFVSFGSSQDHLAEMIRTSADQSSVPWTVAEEAEAGDLVVFYFTKPIAAFLAYGRVIRRAEGTWGKDRKPMAEVGMIRLFPEPVTLRRATERLDLPWLRTPAGFAKRRQEDVALLLALGSVGLQGL